MSMFDFGADGETGPSVQTDIGTSNDLVCQYTDGINKCTVPLSYGGRGRKPVYCEDHKGGKESSSSRTNSSSNTRRKSGAVPERELEQACNNLHTLYEGLLMPLYLVSQDGAAQWESEISRLDASNHTFLANNKKLVRRINESGEKGGTIGFVLAHVFAVAPVALVVYADVTHGRRARAAQAPTPQPSAADNVDFIDVEGVDVPPQYDVDAAFRR